MSQQEIEEIAEEVASAMVRAGYRAFKSESSDTSQQIWDAVRETALKKIPMRFTTQKIVDTLWCDQCGGPLSRGSHENCSLGKAIDERR